MPPATLAATLLSALLPLAPAAVQDENGDADAEEKTEAGFAPLFDGETLDGWAGKGGFWQVEGGAIVGRTSEENPAPYNTFLVSAGEYGDFELRFSYRVKDYNSGVCYRSELYEEEPADAGGFRVKGPQADIDASPKYTGMYYDELGDLGIVARRGQIAEVARDGEVRVVGSCGDEAVLQEKFVKQWDENADDKGGWNTMRVVADGSLTRHYVNGVLFSEVTDDRPDRPKSGVLAFQLHRGPPMELHVKDVRIKDLGGEADVADVAGLDLAPVSDLLAQEYSAGHIGGDVVYAVFHEGEQWSGAVGGPPAPATERALFRLASMTKPVTAAAVLQLADAGKLSLDDPVSKFIPEFKNPRVRTPDGPVPADRAVTVRDLLTHTAGLTYDAAGGLGNGVGPTEYSLEESVARLAERPLAYQPGKSWQYSLANDVLGRVVEVASGERFDRYLKKHLFDPLGMNDTGFAVDKKDADRFAALYAPGEDGRVRPVGGVADLDGWTVDVDAPLNRDGADGDDPGYLSGGAGLVGTAGDYLRFCRMLLNRGELDGVRVLSEESVDAMATNQTGDFPMAFPLHGDGYGYGVGVVSEDLAAREDRPESPGAYGWAGLYLTYFWVDPDRDLAAVLMTQTLPAGAAADLRERFRDAVYQSLEEPDPPAQAAAR